MLLREFGQMNASASVDVENAILRGVKLIGPESKNGYRYSEAALDRAVSLYEKCRINRDHGDVAGSVPERSIGDLVGWVEGVERRPDGIYAREVRLLKGCPATPAILEIAQRNPALIGMSHVADGERDAKNPKLIESILHVHSVDLVSTPATTNGLFESAHKQEGERMPAKPLRDFVKGLKSPKLERRLGRLREEDAAAMVPDMPASEAGAAPEDQLAGAFKQMVMAVLDDDSLDVPGKIAKIKAILQTEEKLLSMNAPAKDTADSTDATDNTDTPAAESVKRENAELRAKLVLAECGVEVRPERVKALMAMTTETERKALAESWKTPAGPAGRTAATPPAGGYKRPASLVG